MMRIIVFTLVYFSLISCTRNIETKSSKFKISLYESYNLVELSEAFTNANKIVRKYLSDSIAKNKTGLVLLDKIQNEGVSSEENLTDRYPLFLVMAPNTRLLENGTSCIDTSAILGMTLDTLTLKKYLKIADSTFPHDIKWEITGKLSSNYKSLHAIKKDSKPILLTEKGIDSVLVMSLGRKYWIEFKLKNELSKTLSSKSYTLILNSDSCEYSGSVVNLEKTPNQHIKIGEMGIDEFKWLKAIFESKIKYKN